MKVIVRSFATNKYSDESLMKMILRICNTNDPNESVRLTRDTRDTLSLLFNKDIDLTGYKYSPIMIYKIFKPYNRLIDGLSRSDILNQTDNFEFHNIFFSPFNKNEGSIRNRVLTTFDNVVRAWRLNKDKSSQLCMPMPFYITNLVSLSILNNRNDYQKLINLKLNRYKYQILDKIIDYYNSKEYNNISLDEYVSSLNLS